MVAYRVGIDQIVAGSPRPVVNTFWVDADPSLFAVGVANAVETAWVAQVVAGQSSTTRTERVRVVNVDGADYAEAAVGADGGNTESAISPQVCLLLKKTVPGIQRKRLGRLFISGISEAAFDAGGNVALNYLNDWTTRGAALVAALQAADVPMVQPIWFSTTQGRTFNTVMPVTGLVPQPRASTQRRRVRA